MLAAPVETPSIPIETPTCNFINETHDMAASSDNGLRSSSLDSKRIAIIGSSLSSLTAAYLISCSTNHQVELFESESQIGGGLNISISHVKKDEKTTVILNVSPDLAISPSATAFRSLMNELNVDMKPANMSWSFCRNFGQFEYSSRPGGYYCMTRSYFSPIAWLVKREIGCFKIAALDLIKQLDQIRDFKEHEFYRKSITYYLDKKRYTKAFFTDCIRPMISALYLISEDDAKNVAILDFVVKLGNLGFLDHGQEGWSLNPAFGKEALGGLLKNVNHVHIGAKVTAVTRDPHAPSEKDRAPLILHFGEKQSRTFDHVILGTDAETAAKLAGDLLNPDELKKLCSFKYTDHTLYLHSDYSLMPSRELAWCGINFFNLPRKDGTMGPSFATYNLGDINQMEEKYFDFGRLTSRFGDVFLTVNSIFPPYPDRIIGEFKWKKPKLGQDLKGSDNASPLFFMGCSGGIAGAEEEVKEGIRAACLFGAKELKMISSHPVGKKKAVLSKPLNQSYINYMLYYAVLIVFIAFFLAFVPLKKTSHQQ